MKINSNNFPVYAIVNGHAFNYPVLNSMAV